jgi:peptidoglycan/LPS O-acetylase OafA/YrhL
VYPVIARKTQTLKREWIALISFGLIFLYIVLYSVIPGDWEHQFLYISPVFRLFDFMLGMALYEAYKFITVNLSEKVQLLSLTKKTMIEVAVVLLLFIMIIAGDNNIVKYGILLSSYFWLPMSCIILVFTLFNKRGG